MKSQNDSAEARLYLGVDIGGTKMQASLVRESGEILCREKIATPRSGGPEQVVPAIEKVIADAMKKGGVKGDDLAAIGIAVPGVVDPDRGLVVVAPNMRLTGVSLGAHLKARFKTPIALGNDGNFGALGESWLGSARKAGSALYICVGTGIGSGLVMQGKLWRGDRESAGEIGHLVMQIDGPKCGCGSHGCLEALASRTAIERDIRQGVAAGRKSAIVELAGGDLSVIRSGAIRKALEMEDELVSEIVRRASQVLGYACLNVRHLIDPEAIVLGGGVIEACSDYIVPIIENIVGRDPLAGARDGGKILLSALGDDARGAGRGGGGKEPRRTEPLQKAVPREAAVPGNFPLRSRRNHHRPKELRPRHFYRGQRQSEEPQARRRVRGKRFDADNRAERTGKNMPRRAGRTLHRGGQKRRRPNLPTTPGGSSLIVRSSSISPPPPKPSKTTTSRKPARRFWPSWRADAILTNIFTSEPRGSSPRLESPK